ncbi:hypothetical protein B0H63DRAFT_509629 [Podospora didyma]|uniref:Oxidase n=1 Tax=Podospora didyma TaxID=330526 RepID=A0AAE0NUH1_9PEZI|nr:hypothetical protein B0H63DRAFT_509629 [Podospora didyma]
MAFGVPFKMKPEYSQIPNGSEDGSEPASPLPFGSEGRPRKTWLQLLTHPALSWTLTAIFASISLILAMALDRDPPAGNGLGTFADGYKTDFVTARPLIQVSQTRFTGGPAFKENGEMYIPNPSPLMYVGDPALHPEIDYNWGNLTWGRYVLISKEEAIATWGESHIEPYWDKTRGGYVAGFDVFHTLHCLNNIRKALNPSFYGTGSHQHGEGEHETRSSPETTAMHQDHCIEQLRQYVMCSGDMTPIGTRYYPGLGRNYVESDVPHTCRSIEPLRRWMVDRYDGGSAVKPVF